MGRPLVAVVVLNMDKREDTLACLESVFALDYAPFRAIVVDNGSRDGSPEAVARSFPQAELLRNEENLGAASGRNAGTRRAVDLLDPSYLLFLDNDTLVERRYLHRLVEALEKDEAAGFAFGKGYRAYPSRTILSTGMRFHRYTGRIEDVGGGQPDEGQYDTPRYEDGCASFGVLARRALIERLGGFDPRYDPYGFEDLDLCLRGARLGMRTLYVPEAVIHHKGYRVGRGPVASYERSKARNYLRLVREHTSALQKLCLAACLPLRALAVAGRLAAQGRPGRVGAQLRGALASLARGR